MVQVSAVILAAGNGVRLGGVAKALIRIDGMPLLQRLMAAVRGAGIHDVLVVTGEHHDALVQVVAPLGARVVRNADVARGQGGSVRLGLASADPHADAVLLLLCDQPLLTSADLIALVDAFISRGAGTFVVPRIGGTRRGNPVLASRGVVEAILASDRYTACRDYMDAHPESVWFMETDNDHYLFDIDEPQDLDRTRARLGCTVELPAQAQRLERCTSQARPRDGSREVDPL